jgi:hypothetical protein
MRGRGYVLTRPVSLSSFRIRMNVWLCCSLGARCSHVRSAHLAPSFRWRQLGLLEGRRCRQATVCDGQRLEQPPHAGRLTRVNQPLGTVDGPLRRGASMIFTHARTHTHTHQRLSDPLTGHRRRRHGPASGSGSTHASHACMLGRVTRGRRWAARTFLGRLPPPPAAPASPRSLGP